MITAPRPSLPRVARQACWVGCVCLRGTRTRTTERVGPPHQNQRCPRAHPYLRVGHRELVLERVSIDAGAPFDQLQAVGRTEGAHGVCRRPGSSLRNRSRLGRCARVGDLPGRLIVSMPPGTARPARRTCRQGRSDGPGMKPHTHMWVCGHAMDHESPACRNSRRMPGYPNARNRRRGSGYAAASIPSGKYSIGSFASDLTVSIALHQI